jgi:hypothetical protein
MSLRGVIINEGRIGTNVAGDSREFAIIGGGVLVANPNNANEPLLSLGQRYELRRLSDAKAIGITQAYDDANNVRIYRHISEFFRRAGEGRVLHLMVTEQAMTPSDMVEDAKTLIVSAGGNVSDIAFLYNPPANYAPEMVDGLDSNVKAAIATLQTFAIWADEHDMPLHCILEGRGISDNLSSLGNLREITAGDAILEATKVTMVVGQDWKYAEGLDAIGKKYADAGTFLGVVASASWNSNPGEVETQNITDAARRLFEIGGLSNHKQYNEVFEDLETLDEKGYVLVIKYQGESGYWFNDGHVCSPIIVDAQGNMNQHTIYYSHTIDMAKRALRKRLLMEIKKTVHLLEGTLPSCMVKYYEAAGNLIFDNLAKKGLISQGTTTVDKDSDLLVAKELKVGFAVIPTGSVNVINGTINLKNQ